MVGGVKINLRKIEKSFKKRLTSGGVVVINTPTDGGQQTLQASSFEKM